jgi:D-beta-D-heptose 7-phosphate kinase/D-beta-D-heptose 1-phosphate adenosyltransferase
MSTLIPDFSQTKILVAGDLMLDRYWSGNTRRISPEAPVPVVLIKDFEERSGGAGNVAQSITALGGQCALAALLGEDEAAEQLEKMLQRENVTLHSIKDPIAKTVAKLRVLSRNQQLIRLDFEAGFSEESVTKLTSIICDELERYNVLILSDYNKGALKHVSEIISKANAMGTSVFVDPKGSNFSKYKNVTAITPNYSEFTSVVGEINNEQDLVEKGQHLLNELNLSALVITRSNKGVTLLEKSGKTVNVPARAKEVFDVTGAGDTFISVLAASYAAGSSFEEAVNIANAAASVVVGKLGAATVSTNEIDNELNGSRQILNKILSKNQLLEEVKQHRADDKKVVMTNGCFDILHAGHVEYLSKAKELGDILIVAVNSDQSVGKNKGPSRPINNVRDRMSVLSALQAVDWVVEFDQETPEELIKAILPDTLVKGGDYRIEDIVGASAVSGNGGEVRVIEFVEDKSTTAVISKIRNS